MMDSPGALGSFELIVFTNFYVCVGCNSYSRFP